LGGTNTYRGQVKQKPLLAEPIYPITPARIRQALDLTQRAVLVWLAMGLIVIVAFYTL